MKKTPWFSGDVKPARPGVYQRRFFDAVTMFARWDGGQWLVCRDRSREAAREWRASHRQHGVPWRGLAAPAKKEG